MRSTISAGLIVAACVAACVRISAAQVQQPGAARVLQAGDLLTNDSIVRLVKAGISEQLVLRIVNTRPGKYDLGVDDIIALKTAGVSDEILDAMLSQSPGVCPPASNVPIEILATPGAASNPAAVQSSPAAAAGQPNNQPASTAGPARATPNSSAAAPSRGAYRYTAGAKPAATKPQK